MKFTIIGAGNTGFAAAIYFQSRGAQTLVYTRKPEKKEKLNQTALTVSGAIQGSSSVQVTSDLKEAIDFGDYLLILTWANAHKNVFCRLKNQLKPHQKILIFNGNWGAYEAVSILGEELTDKHILLGETTSQIFLADFSEPFHLHIKAVKQTLSLSGLNRNQTDILKNDLSVYFQTIIPMENIIETSLSAGNPIIHVPLSLFHITRIENKEQYFFLGQSSPKAIQYIEQIDEERVRIGKQLHVNCKKILDELNSFWDEKYNSLYEIFHKNPMYCRNSGPVSLGHRFITEDIPYGITPIRQLGQLFHVETPYAEAIEKIFLLYLGQTFREEAIDFDRQLIEKLANNKYSIGGNYDPIK